MKNTDEKNHFTEFQKPIETWIENQLTAKNLRVYKEFKKQNLGE